MAGSSATDVGLPDAAAPRRPDLQRDRVRARSSAGPAAIGCSMFGALVAHGDRPVHADPPRGGHADPGPVGLDVRDGPRRRADVRGLHAHRPEQRPGRAARDGDQQPDVLPAGRRHGRAGAHRDDLRDDGWPRSCRASSPRAGVPPEVGGRWPAAAGSTR